MSTIILNTCVVNPVQPSGTNGAILKTSMIGVWAFLQNPIPPGTTVTFRFYAPGFILVDTQTIPADVVDNATCASYGGPTILLAPGVWAVSVQRNDTGVVEAANPVIVYPSPELTLTAQSTNTSCAQNNGSVTFSFYGGGIPNIPYNYVIYRNGVPFLSGSSLPGVPITANALSPASYTLIVTSLVPGCAAGDCSFGTASSAGITVGVSPSLVPIVVDDIIIANSSCNATDGSIELEVSSSCSPSSLTVAWTGPNGYSGNTLLIEGLAAGTYSYTLTDCNCTLTGDVVVENEVCCWTLTSCTPVCGEILVISVDNDLTDLSGMVINGVQIEGIPIEPKVCWIVGLGTCASPSSTLLDYATSFSNCVECSECPIDPCGCMPGYTQNPEDPTECIKTFPATPPQCTLEDCSIVQGPTSPSYSFESPVYPELNALNIPITIDIGPARFVDNTLATFNPVSTLPLNSCWGPGFTGGNEGRLNQIGIWTGDPTGAPFLEFIGFEVCVEVPATRVYYVGLSTDNAGRFFVDGTLYVDSYYVPNAHQPFAYNYWHVFPIKLTAGIHIIRIEGLNESAGPNLGSFAAEIYDATLAELQACTVPTDLDGNNAQGRPLVVWNTLEMVGGVWQTGILGYTCPEGFELDTCSGTPVCKRIIPFVDCPEEDTCTHPFPEPVKTFFEIKESSCDINAIKQFSILYWDKVKAERYGIAPCCTIRFERAWIKKELSDLALITLPGYICKPPQPTCHWVPKCCDMIPDAAGGVSVTGIAFQTIRIGNVVSLGLDGKFHLNDPTNLANYQRVVGLATHDAMTNYQVRVIVKGDLTNSQWNLTTGATYYAGNSGTITTTAPTSGILQIVGTAISSTTLRVDIQQPVIL